MTPGFKRFLTGRSAFIILLTALSILLLIQFFFNRSLWFDEGLLALNIIKKDFKELTLPLDYQQVAPILFLQLEKLFSLFFGTSEKALRFFPLIAAFLSFPLYYHLVLSLTNKRGLAMLCVLLLGLTPAFIYFSSEVKQYSSDVFAALTINLVVFGRNNFLIKYKKYFLPLVGIIAVFLSNIAIATLFVAAGWLAWEAYRDQSLRKLYLVSIAVWFLSFCIYYLLFIRNHPTAAFMHNYWNFAFFPLNGSLHNQLQWLFITALDLVCGLLPVPFSPPFLTCLAILCGLIFLIVKRQYLILYICIAPIAIHFILSALHIYPFNLRLVLYQLPLYLLLLGIGFYEPVILFVKNLKIRAAVFTLFMGCFSLHLLTKFPIKREELRPLIDFANKNIKQNDQVYIYSESGPVFEYYQTINYVQFHQPVLRGKAQSNQGEELLRELKDIKGRVWLFFSHYRNKSKDAFPLDALKMRGSEIYGYEGNNASVYLFDLK